MNDTKDYFAEFERQMQQHLNLARDFTPLSLSHVSHEAWRAVVAIMEPDRLHSGVTASINLSLDEITSSKERGNNLANVLIAMQYLSLELESHQSTRRALFDQLGLWAADIRPVSEKIRHPGYQIITRVVLKVARFMHLGYSIANINSTEYLSGRWELTSSKNRKKSYAVALILMDHIIARLFTNHPSTITIDSVDLDNVLHSNLEVTEAQTENHLLWEAMLKLTYMLDPMRATNGRVLLDRYERALRSNDPLINGGQDLNEEKILARLHEARQVMLLDVTQIASAAVHHGWTVSQTANPFRITVLYKPGEKTGGRTRVKFGQLSPVTQAEYWSEWGAALVEMHLRKVMGDERYIARRNEMGSVENLAREELTVELDPRIVGYPVLTDLDRGNNIVATAMTWMSYCLERIEAHSTTQETVDELCWMILHGQNSFDYSKPMIVARAAEMHAIWAACALQRDGVDPSRFHQIRLFNLLPGIDQADVDPYSDEKHYDVEAVVNGLVYLIQGFVTMCSRLPFPEPCVVHPDVMLILERHPLEVSLSAT